MDIRIENKTGRESEAAQYHIHQKKTRRMEKILVRTGQTLTIAARSINGVRFQEQDEPPMHTAMTFKERVAEARKDKLARRSERAKKARKRYCAKM